MVRGHLSSPLRAAEAVPVLGIAFWCSACLRLLGSGLGGGWEKPPLNYSPGLQDFDPAATYGRARFTGNQPFGKLPEALQWSAHTLLAR